MSSSKTPGDASVLTGAKEFDESNFRHHHEEINGLRQHFVTAGEGPAILFLHGFPDMWLGWRPLMRAFVGAGFKVIAPDLRGHGETDAPMCSDQATALDVMGDLVAILDTLAIPHVGVIAHDWGAEIGWTAAKVRPDRFAAIAALSVPYVPYGDLSLPNILEQSAPPSFYLRYFLEEGLAEAELDQDPETFLRRIFHTSSGRRQEGGVPPLLATEKGLIDGLEEPCDARSLIGEDLACYVATFTRAGFRGALSSYRSLHRNWQLMSAWADRTVEVPALYIGGEWDVVLNFPGMRDLVGAMPTLLPRAEEPVIFPAVGHFIHWERPEEVGCLLLDFFRRNHPELHAALPDAVPTDLSFDRRF
jgi:pimeloyl-ACP methyl ester carboxylesterase